MSKFAIAGAFLLLFGIILAIIAFTSSSPGVDRIYYIQAETIDWRYIPFESPEKLSNGTWISHSDSFKWKKSVYREYNDSTFTHRKMTDQTNRGILGPAIRASVGDSIVVHFKNSLDINASIDPRGVLYSYDEHEERRTVLPGDTFTYRWQVPERSGPSSNDPTSISWIYTSESHPEADVHSGLIGPIVITRRNQGSKKGIPIGVDKEFITLFASFDERKSNYYQENLERYIAANPGYVHLEEEHEDDGDGDDDDNQVAIWVKPSINGRQFDTLQGMSARVGDAVRWYVMSMENERYFHVPSWEGNTVVASGIRKNSLMIMSGQTMSVDMFPDNVGTWGLRCVFGDDMLNGMKTVYYITN
eukprot:TRINITY_DN10009_c0_g1_i1.p1 TRINITY_DN10009_c0_g1~~TRINITY_DN10009_c0_g1_i1.p1  ORF type:complete len:407 (-),score=52.43 TRINITY_DN10009_c0_g1_i1:32-1111(-)